jgi:hypothetical protein
MFRAFTQDFSFAQDWGAGLGTKERFLAVTALFAINAPVVL